MGEIVTSININAGGNFLAQMRQNEQRWIRFSKTGQRQMTLLSRSVAVGARGLDRLGNRYTALLSGAAGAGTGKFLVNLERRFTRLGIQADISAEQVDGLKQKIFEAARQDNIRIDPSEITSAIEAIVEKTGDLKFAEDNIKNIGYAINATGANGAAIGEILAEFQKMGIVDFNDVLTGIDTLNVQGKEGAFTLQELAALGPRVVTAYTSLGRGGLPAIREMGAALQVIRQGTGSSEQAATSFEALLRTLSDVDKVKMLQSGGIKLFDEKALKEGREVLRPINEIMIDIIKKTQGKKTILSKVFDAEAMRSFNAASAEFQRIGSLESLDKFMKVHADGTATINDSTRAAKDSAAALQSLYSAWQNFADSNLTTHIKSMADALNSVDPDTLDKLIKAAVYGGTALGGLVLAKKAVGVGKGISDFIKGGKEGKGGAAGALGDMAGVQPVYVVNMGKGGLGGMGGKGGTGFKRAAKLGKFESARAMSKLSLIPKLGLAATGVAGLAVAGSGAAGYGLGAGINKMFIEGTEFQEQLGRSIAKALAFFGNDNASSALNIEKKNSLQIEIIEGKAKVKSMQTDGLDMSVDTGSTVGGM